MHAVTALHALDHLARPSPPCTLLCHLTLPCAPLCTQHAHLSHAREHSYARRLYHSYLSHPLSPTSSGRK
eukprot:5208100-Pleurochrysis_carterae.AAC.1